MTELLSPRLQVGARIRTLHRYGFRRGDWARITAYVEDEAGGPCWLVEFPDGVKDWWRTDDSAGQYEIVHDTTTATAVVTRKGS